MDDPEQNDELRAANDSRQRVIEILSKAIGEVIPDFRANGGGEEHATKVADALREWVRQQPNPNCFVGQVKRLQMEVACLTVERDDLQREYESLRRQDKATIDALVSEREAARAELVTEHDRLSLIGGNVVVAERMRADGAEAERDELARQLKDYHEEVGRRVAALIAERDVALLERDEHSKQREDAEKCRNALRAEVASLKDVARAPIREWLEKNKDAQVRALFEENKERDIEIGKLRAQVEERIRFEQGIMDNAPACGACAEGLFTGVILHEHDVDCPVAKVKSLTDEFIKPDPYGGYARATVIWQDDEQVTQAMWDRLHVEKPREGLGGGG